MPQLSPGPDAHTSPNAIPWPPVLLALTLLVAWLLDRSLPEIAGYKTTGYLVMTELQRLSGWLIVAIAIALDIWVFLIFRKHNTNIRPDRAALHLVTSGPFAYSRNPIYAGNVSIVLGLAIAKGSVWFLLLAPVLFLLIQELAIKREEAHMASRFGKAWENYAAQVRRWL